MKICYQQEILVFLQRSLHLNGILWDKVGKLHISKHRKSGQAIYIMSADERVKENIRMREKALHDQASMLAAEREEGRTEGIEAMIAGMRAAGLEEEQIEAARKNAK